MYKLFEKVITAKGPGTVIGFEHFDMKGNELPVSPEDTGNRIIVRLKDKEKDYSEGTPDPHFFRSEVHPLCSTH